MTRRTEMMWRELNVLAETDAHVAALVRGFRMGLMSWEEMLMAGWLSSAIANNTLRTQLVDAISLQPRIYFLEKP